MKSSRLLLWVVIACFFLSFSTVFAHADSVPGDPVIQIDDPTCGGELQPACPVVGDGTPFFFQANGQGGGAMSFEVDPTPGTPGIFSLDIETFGVFETTRDVQCFSDAFECSVSFIGDGTVTDIFLTENGDAGKNGFAPGTIFTIDLGNLASTDCDPTQGLCPTTEGGGWQANQVFRAQGDLSTAPTDPLITAPEPSSVFFLTTGTLLLLGKRKMFRGSR